MPIRSIGKQKNESLKKQTIKTAAHCQDPSQNLRKNKDTITKTKKTKILKILKILKNLEPPEAKYGTTSGLDEGGAMSNPQIVGKGTRKLCAKFQVKIRKTAKNPKRSVFWQEHQLHHHNHY